MTDTTKNPSIAFWEGGVYGPSTEDMLEGGVHGQYTARVFPGTETSRSNVYYNWASQPGESRRHLATRAHQEGQKLENGFLARSLFEELYALEGLIPAEKPLGNLADEAFVGGHHQLLPAECYLQVPVKDSYSILDFGSGEGYVTQEIAKRFAWEGKPVHAVAVELSDTAIGHAKKRLSDIPSLTFEGVVPKDKDTLAYLEALCQQDPKPQFDAILAIETMFNLDEEGKQRLIAAADQLLVEGGIFCGVDYVAVKDSDEMRIMQENMSERQSNGDIFVVDALTQHPLEKYFPNAEEREFRTFVDQKALSWYYAGISAEPLGATPEEKEKNRQAYRNIAERLRPGEEAKSGRFMTMVRKPHDTEAGLER